MPSYPVLAAAAALAASLLYLRATRRPASTPPGPPPLPLIGNLLDIPREKEVLTYNDMADKYGEIVYLSVLSKKIFIVSSARILNELFNQRSANYSDRPHSTMLNSLMDLEWIFAFASYGATWRATRKLFHAQFQEAAVPALRPLQVRSAHQVVRDIMKSPERLFEHLHLHVAGFLMEVAYAAPMTPATAALVGMADDVIAAWSKVAVPGAYLVDAMPILRFIPEWLLPGGGFRRDAREARRKAETARDAPFRQVEREVAAGTAPPSFVSNLLNAAGASDVDADADVGAERDLIRACAGTIYFAGTEAIAISLNAFVLAMVTNPAVQARAHAELDAALGRDRLPDFGDADALPYVSAIVKEVMRWNPPAPLAIPHVTVAADSFAGYHIPAKSLVIGNLWKILHDPAVYPAPTAFQPERFLAPRVTPLALSTLECVFGPGRRICPGRWVAQAQLFVSIASLLYAFEFRPKAGVQSEDVKAEFTYGLACHPVPFEYSIKTRGKHVEELLNMADN
ncbi:cytochrome P450 monooxygenase [Mycena belliarum]|uniref:Cytochrome P450 monooxygenase n=1 Tax=Mycena belliarum TaxID=1033014 RepID=A0AAD6U052_9AGAR|nr:cytochrome P450 monooxygenase [Mycena belliae]